MRRLSTRAAGLLILILGIWGGLVPFVGPYFHFTMGPTKSWTWTTGRLWLDVLPGAVAVLGGLLLLGAGPRPSGKLGALLALAAGLWFAIGPDVSLLWNASGAQGAAHGAKFVRVLEMLSYHTLLGAVIAALAGYALPGLVTRRAAAEAEEAEADSAAPAAVTAGVGPTRPLRAPARTTASEAGAGEARMGTASEAAAVREQRAPARAEGPIAAEPVGNVGRQPVDEPVGNVGRQPVDEPAGNAGRAPVDEPAGNAGRAPVYAPTDGTRGSGGGEAPTAVIDRPLADDRRDAPAVEGGAADRGAADAPTSEAPVAAGSSAGSSEPVTVRRRSGGLLSRIMPG